MSTYIQVQYLNNLIEKVSILWYLSVYKFVQIKKCGCIQYTDL